MASSAVGGRSRAAISAPSPRQFPAWSAWEQVWAPRPAAQVLVAAVAFAVVLYKIVRSPAVSSALTSIVKSALNAI